MNSITRRAALFQRSIRVLAPVVLGILCLIALGDRLDGISMAAVRDSFGALSALQWGAALAATALSFWALGRYDAVVHRHLGTGVGRRAAIRSGAAAIALAQVLGLGVVTGALARWRMLPGLKPMEAARVSAVVALSFMAAWAVVTALALLIAAPAGLPVWIAPLVLALAAGIAVLAFLRPEFRILNRRMALPTLPAMGAILGFAALDTMAAALALFVLLPSGAVPGFELVFAAYLVALGAALLTGTPGGVGPFELTLVMMLPAVPDADLMGAILAFRLVYYALPACLALVPLARPRRGAVERSARLRPFSSIHLGTALRAELGVARQNGALRLSAPGADAAVVRTGQGLTLLFSTLRGPLGPILRALRAEARAQDRVPCLYKIDARDAAAVRKAGWRVVRVADEAVIAPGAFDTSGSTHRQLRRKLRHAEKAGITARHAALADIPVLARIDAQWQARHGGARGLTVGRFCADYIAGQRIYVAERGTEAVGFVTFHTGPAEWTLDLMRHGDDLPDGTMQALIVAALEDAKTMGVPRLSLAAMPADAPVEHKALARLRREIALRSGGTGLTRFKTAFAPRRAPLYAAAPTRAGLILALGDLARAIRATPQAPGDYRPAHHDVEEPAVAFSRRT